MYYIGVDLGTSAVKLLLMDGEGKSARSSQRNILYTFSPGMVRAESTDWFTQVWKGSRN